MMKVHLVPVHQFGGYKCCFIHLWEGLRDERDPSASQMCFSFHFSNAHGFVDAVTEYTLTAFQDLCNLCKSARVCFLGFFFVCFIGFDLEQQMCGTVRSGEALYSVTTGCTKCL